MSQDDWINRDFVLSDGTTVGEALDHPGVSHDPDKYDYYVTPGATLEALMHERNMTIAEAAARCDLPATTIRGVIKAEVAITEQIAAGLEKGRHIIPRVADNGTRLSKAKSPAGPKTAGTAQQGVALRGRSINPAQPQTSATADRGGDLLNRQPPKCGATR